MSPTWVRSFSTHTNIEEYTRVSSSWGFPCTSTCINAFEHTLHMHPKWICWEDFQPSNRCHYNIHRLWAHLFEAQCFYHHTKWIIKGMEELPLYQCDQELVNSLYNIWMLNLVVHPIPFTHYPIYSIPSTCIGHFDIKLYCAATSLVGIWNIFMIISITTPKTILPPC